MYITDGKLIALVETYEEPKTMADFVRPEYRGFPEGFVEPGSLKTKH